MDEDRLLALFPNLLRTHWERSALAVQALGGGMNSITALVDLDHDRFVAKWVPAPSAGALLSGAEIAAALAGSGLRSGPPLPTCSGDLVIPADDGFLTLLQFIPGHPLTPAEDHQPLLADALGQAHAALGTTRRRAAFFEWLGDDPAVATIADWILPAIRAVLAEYRSLPAVTWGTLHTDPAPEAFLLDDDQGIGIIDWTGACSGPLLYDVASAIMYLGGPENGSTFLTRYAARGPLPRQEMDDHLVTFRRFRAIVQADYFARRLLSNDLTGIDGPADNRTGLSHAHAMLSRLGVITD